jgi:hypothetical protein
MNQRNVMMRSIHILTITSWLILFQLISQPAIGEGPLPNFTFEKVALHPKDLKYSPTEQLIHPTIIETEGRIENPLGKYYMYYAPHKHIATSMAYSDSLDGPWKEYTKNPVIEGPSAPDIRWIEEKKLFYMWGHKKNSQTELWTSKDGIQFEYHSVSVKASEIGTRNATYSRCYEYPLKKYGSRYIMLYSGFIEGENKNIRCVWLAHSKDAINWTQLKTPLIEPIEGDGNDLYGPAWIRWKNKNYVTFQDHTSWRGGNLKYVEVDEEFTPVGRGGERHILIDPPDEPPVNNRYRGAEFYIANNKLYLYSSASKDPRLIVYATAKVEDQKYLQKDYRLTPNTTKTEKGHPKEHTGNKPNETIASTKKQKNKLKTEKLNKTKELLEKTYNLGSLTEILKNYQLETIYETRFDEPLNIVKEESLIVDRKRTREPSKDTDWVLEGPAEIKIKEGRMYIKNQDDANCVLWNTREFPESFVAEWDFQHHYPSGLGIIFFSASGLQGGSIFSTGLPRRDGKFGNYTKGKIKCYHTSYTAIEEDGTPRGSTHLKKNTGDLQENTGGKVSAGPVSIDGKSNKPHLFRLAKLENRIILEIDGEISFDWTDTGKKGGPSFKSGQIGFRQMRHTIEGSYGGLKIQKVMKR